MQSSMYQGNQTLTNLCQCFLLACVIVSLSFFCFPSPCRISSSSRWRLLPRRWMPSWRLFHSRHRHLLSLCYARLAFCPEDHPPFCVLFCLSSICYPIICSFPSYLSLPPSDTSPNLFSCLLFSSRPSPFHPPLHFLLLSFCIFTWPPAPLIFTHVFTIYLLSCKFPISYTFSSFCLLIPVCLSHSSVSLLSPLVLPLDTIPRTS